MAAGVRATTAIVTGSATSTVTVPLTTEAGDSDLVVFVFTSHGRTISTSAYDGAAMSSEVAVANGNTTSACLRLRAAPGAKSANFTATLSGAANWAAVAYYVTGSDTAAVLDFDSLTGNGVASALTLTSESGGLVLSGMHSSPAGAMTFTGGTEDTDGGGATGQVGTGHILADAATETADWGSETTFAHVAISLGDGGGAPPASASTNVYQRLFFHLWA